MPYNTNPIPQNRDITGQAQLPLARVKRMIAIDSDIGMCSNNAAFVITIAAELFVQHLAEQGIVVVKSERKPRRNIQYKDLAQAVASRDNLEFLVDVIPKTVQFKEVKNKKAPTSSATVVTNGEGNNLETGQMTLDGMNGSTNGNGIGDVTGRPQDAVDEDADEIPDPNTQLQNEMSGGRFSTGSAVSSEAVNGHNISQDVEMS